MVNPVHHIQPSEPYLDGQTKIYTLARLIKLPYIVQRATNVSLPFQRYPPWWIRDRNKIFPKCRVTKPGDECCCNAKQTTTNRGASRKARAGGGKIQIVIWSRRTLLLAFSVNDELYSADWIFELFSVVESNIMNLMVQLVWSYGLNLVYKATKWTAKWGLVNNFLRVPLACLGSTEGTVLELLEILLYSSFCHLVVCTAHLEHDYQILNWDTLDDRLTFIGRWRRRPD